MKEKLLKNNYYKIILAILYMALFIPYVYSIFYSMPATDDYAWAIEWFSTNRLVEVVKRVQWNYMNWFGQSGVFAVVIQILFNPLYWFKDVGHSFGICMVLVFSIIVVGLIYSIRGLCKALFSIEDSYVLDIYVALIISLLFTTYYYSDVYNWWSGVPGYFMMMVVMILSMKYIAEYVNNPSLGLYMKLLVIGMIACTGLMNCVALGLFYIYINIINNGTVVDRKKLVIPFMCYVLSGIITVIAPGNYRRTSTYDKGEVDYIGSIGVTLYTIITRALQTLIKYPWTLALFIIIVLLAILSKSNKIGNINIVLVGTILTIISAGGALYPYVVGERKHIGEEFAPRALFVTDYIMFIGFSIVAFELGLWLSDKTKVSIRKRIFVILSICIVCISAMLAKIEGNLMYVVQYDIYRQSTQIAEIYNEWEDIIDEIKTSPNEEIVIKKENVPWTRFSYPVGIDDGNGSRIPSDIEYYGNVNQCTQRWFDKSLIKVYIN